MKVLCAGGGSGGHVTPVVVVINEIAKLEPDLEVLFICDKAFEEQARGLMKTNAVVPVETTVITAGKFRRYKHLSVLQHLLIPNLVWSNIRDLFRVAIGLGEAMAIFTTYKPDVVFAKGGYVCLPVGIAAKIFRVPLVIHDSDARVGMTNNIIGKWATKIGTGSPLENYPYPKEKAEYVGVPIAAEFHPYTIEEQAAAKQKLGFEPNDPLVVVTGGGLGAKSINEAMTRIIPDLVEQGVNILHVTGKAHYDDVMAETAAHDRYKPMPFVYKDMADVLGAADVVVSRASATFIQEIAGLAKPSILIPSRALGDQIKNADAYKLANAAVVLSDDEIEGPAVALRDAILKLLTDKQVAQTFANALHAFARPDAAKDVARLVVSARKS